MIARQQTQLKEFFSVQEDPVFLIDHKGNIVFSNEAARSLFESLGFKEIDKSAKLFTFTTSDQEQDKDV